MGSDPVNLYALILGLPNGIAEPDYYQLLGLPRFTEDQAAIRNAAAAQNGKILSWQNSEYFRPSLELTKQVVEALRVLSDAESKREYDSRLRRTLGIAETLSFDDHPTEELPVAEIVMDEPRSRPRTRSKSVRGLPVAELITEDEPRRKRWPILPVIASTVFLGLALVVAFKPSADVAPEPDPVASTPVELPEENPAAVALATKTTPAEQPIEPFL